MNDTIEELHDFEKYGNFICQYLRNVVAKQYPDLIDDPFDDIIIKLSQFNETKMVKDLLDMRPKNITLLPYYALCNSIDRIKDELLVLQSGGNVSGLTARVTALETGLTTTNSDISTLNTKVTTINNVLPVPFTHINGVSTVRGVLIAWDPYMRHYSASVYPLFNNAPTIPTRITTLETFKTSTDTTLASLNSSVTALNTSNSTLSSNYDTLNTSVTSLNNQMSSVNSQITSVNASINTVNNTISSTVADIYERNSALYNMIIELTRKVENNPYNIVNEYDFEKLLSGSSLINNIKSIQNQLVTLDENVILSGLPLDGIWNPSWAYNNIDYIRWYQPQILYDNSIMKFPVQIPNIYGTEQHTSIRDDGWIGSTQMTNGLVKHFIGLQSDAVFLKQTNNVSGTITLNFINYTSDVFTQINQHQHTEISRSAFATLDHVTTSSDGLNKTINDTFDNYIMFPSSVKADKTKIKYISALGSKCSPYQADRGVTMAKKISGTVSPTLLYSINRVASSHLMANIDRSPMRTFNPDTNTIIAEASINSANWNKFNEYISLSMVNNNSNVIPDGSQSFQNLINSDSYAKYSCINTFTTRITLLLGDTFHTMEMDFYGDPSDGLYDSFNSYIDIAPSDFPNIPPSYDGVTINVTHLSSFPVRSINPNTVETITLDLSQTYIYAINGQNVITINPSVYSPDLQSFGCEIVFNPSLNLNTTQYNNMKNAFGISISGNLKFNANLLIPPVGYVSSMSYMAGRWYEAMKDTNRQIQTINQRIDEISEVVNAIQRSLVSMSGKGMGIGLTIVSALISVGEVVLTAFFPPMAPFIMAGSAMIGAAVNVIGMAAAGITDISAYATVIGNALFQVAVVTGILNNVKNALGLTTKSAIQKVVSTAYKKLSSYDMTALKNRIASYFPKIKTRMSRAPLYNVSRDPFVVKKNTIETVLTGFTTPGLNKLSTFLVRNFPSLITRLDKLKKAPAHSMTVVHTSSVDNLNRNVVTRIISGVTEGFNVASTSVFSEGMHKVGVGYFEFKYTETNANSGIYLLDSPPTELYTNSAMKDIVLKNIYQNLDSSTIISGQKSINRSYITNLKTNGYGSLTNNDWDDLWNGLEKSFTLRYNNSAITTSSAHNIEPDTVRAITHTALDNYATRPYNLLTHNCQHFSYALKDSVTTGQLSPIMQMVPDEQTSMLNLINNFENYTEQLDTVSLSTLSLNSTSISMVSLQSELSTTWDYHTALKNDITSALATEINNPSSPISVETNVNYSAVPDWLINLNLQPTQNVRSYIMSNVSQVTDMLMDRSTSIYDNSFTSNVSSIAMENMNSSLKL